MKIFVLLASIFVLVTCQPIEVPIAGGITNTPAEHFSYLTPNLLALEREMDNRIDSPYVHRVGKITQAKSQVVAGARYYINFDFGQTNCLKNSTTAIETCNEVVQNRSCYADIWAQPWLDRRELMDFRCN